MKADKLHKRSAKPQKYRKHVGKYAYFSGENKMDIYTKYACKSAPDGCPGCGRSGNSEAQAAGSDALAGFAVKEHDLVTGDG